MAFNTPPSIIRELKLHRGKHYAVSPRFSAYVQVAVKPDYLNPFPVEYGQELRMELRLGLDFNTRDKHYDKAVQWAKRTILEHLYADALCVVRELRAELYAGDDVKAIQLLDTLEEVMTEVRE